MENEIGGRWIDGVDILDGNITPIMPFEDTEIPEEKAVVTFFVLDRETEEFISDVIIKLEDSNGHIIKMLNGESYEILKQTYTYTIEKEGYETQSDTIIVDKNINKVIFLDEAVEDPPVGDDFTYVIEGADSIMWNQTKTYTVRKYNDGVEVDGVFTFALEGEYATIVSSTDNTVNIKAKNNVWGNVTLKATDVDNGEIVTKEILIKGLV